eukprot:m.18438 g.18438  ORF g.18438 m.18438 type:complete len:152 (+) comp10807_c0_seq1:290-745(+)
MDDPTIQLLNEVAAISTSNGWSVLDSVLMKLNRHRQPPLSARTLGTALHTAPAQALLARGIWVHSFGSKYAPIICVNRAFSRTYTRLGADAPCTCKLTDNEGSKYFSSQAYNAGRHAAPLSSHIASCTRWTPPEAGHLHSWRRGYADNSKD